MISARAAAILGMAIVIAVGLWLYFAPYQQCVRFLSEKGQDDARYTCWRLMYGR